MKANTTEVLTGITIETKELKAGYGDRSVDETII